MSPNPYSVYCSHRIVDLASLRKSSSAPNVFEIDGAAVFDEEVLEERRNDGPPVAQTDEPVGLARRLHGIRDVVRGDCRVGRAGGGGTSGAALSAGAAGASAVGAAAGVGSSGGSRWRTQTQTQRRPASVPSSSPLWRSARARAARLRKMSSATVAKKECRCRPIERAMENLWSALDCKEANWWRARCYTTVRRFGEAPHPDHPRDSPRPHRQTIGRSRRDVPRFEKKSLSREAACLSRWSANAPPTARGPARPCSWSTGSARIATRGTCPHGASRTTSRGRGSTSSTSTFGATAGRVISERVAVAGWRTMCARTSPAAVEEVQALSGGRSVWVVGHSLGGLVAYASAPILSGAIAGVASIGSPYHFTRGSLTLGALSYFFRAVALAPLPNAPLPLAPVGMTMRTHAALRREPSLPPAAARAGMRALASRTSSSSTCGSPSIAPPSRRCSTCSTGRPSAASAAASPTTSSASRRWTCRCSSSPETTTTWRRPRACGRASRGADRGTRRTAPCRSGTSI